MNTDDEVTLLRNKLLIMREWIVELENLREVHTKELLILSDLHHKLLGEMKAIKNRRAKQIRKEEK
jgi:hypothetical protein